MPSETEIAPPTETPTIGVGPTPSKTSRGDTFRQQLEKIEAQIKENPSPEPEAKPEPEKPAEPTPESEAKPEVTPEPEKPAKVESPLDAVLAKDKPEEKPTVDSDSVIADLEKIEVPKSEHWKRARETMRTQAEQLKALKTAPKPTVDDSPVLKERDELKKALEERENTIKAINAEYSPEYQKLVGKYQGTAEKIKTRMQSFGADGDSLITALSLPYSKARTDQIDVALENLDAGKQGRIQSLIEELEGHGEEISEFRKDLPKRYEEMAAAQEKAAREQHVNAIKQLETEFVKISEVLPDSTVTLREVPDDVPGGTEWNKEISEARTNALRVLKPDGADFNESVSIALKGARYDTLEKRYLALHADYSALKKRFSDEDSAGPDFKGTSKPSGKGDKPRITKYQEALAARKSAGDMDQ